MEHIQVEIVFCYSFPHKKTSNGLLALINNGIIPKLIIAAPWKQLDLSNGPTSAPKFDWSIPTAKDIANQHGIEYLEAKHNSVEVISVIKKIKPAIGLILGARILPVEVIRAFSRGILNMHGGVLPLNRGLDCQKWAVLLGLPQGTSLHFITEEIDKGIILDTSIIPVFEDDTIEEISERIQEKEIEILLSYLFQKQRRNFSNSISGVYHGQMDEVGELQFLADFSNYKKNYQKVLSSWQNSS